VDAVRSVDTLAFILASIAILAAVTLTGILLAPAPMLPSAGPPYDGALCEEEPIVPVAQTGIHGLTQLCITEVGIRVWIELVGMRPDALHTGWLAYGSRSLSSRELRCGGSRENGSETRLTLRRINGTIASHTGHTWLMTSHPDVRLTGEDDVWILVVDHGVLPSGDHRSIVAWDPGWWATASATAPDTSITGRLTGCARFRRRAGVESLE
jgi:hypothetical protein